MDHTPTVNSEPPPPTVNPAPARKSSGRGWLLVLFVILAGTAVYYFWFVPKQKSDSAGKTEAGATNGKKGGRGGGGPIPVVATKARKGNIGVYLSGLGSVTPIYTVTVKSVVGGELMDIRYKEGDTVHKGDPLVVLDERPFRVALEQAEGQLARDQALLDNARVDMTRYQGLLAQNAIPEQQVATQKALVGQYEGTVKIDQGQIDSAKLNLTYCRINAPISGRIGLRLVDPGNIVSPNDPNGLLVITQLEPISVIFTIAEDQLPPVAKKMHAGQKLSVDAWDRELKNKIASGVLSTLDNQIDQTTGTLKLRATFDNKNDSLYPNQFVNARLLVEQKNGVTLLNTSAIQRTTSNTYVYLVKPDLTVTIRNITVGTTEGDDSQITSGVVPGDQVVMTGVDKLNEGSKVSLPVPGENGRGGRGAGTGAPQAAPAGASPAAPKRGGKRGATQ
jgi:multidrug efflux system membrane fusion protein